MSHERRRLRRIGDAVSWDGMCALQYDSLIFLVIPISNAIFSKWRQPDRVATMLVEYSLCIGCHDIFACCFLWHVYLTLD